MVVQFLAPKHKKGCEAMSKEVKAIIYARQSSGDDDVSASVEQQVKNCQQLARECGYCGDFGSISSLHPSEKAKLMGGGRTHRSDPRHGDGYL